MRDGVTVSCLQALALTSLCVYCLAHVLIWGMGEQIIPIFPSVFPQMFSHYLDQWFFHKTRCTKVNQQINHNSRGRLFIFLFSVNLTNYIPLFGQTPICPLNQSFRSHFLFSFLAFRFLFPHQTLSFLIHPRLFCRLLNGVGKY